MLRDQDALLSLVEAIHDGAASPEAWLTALDRLSDAFGGSAILIGTTPIHGGRFKLAGHRMLAESVAAINGSLASREANPLFRAMPRAPLRRAVIMSRLVDDRELLGSKVYQQAMRPSGVRHVMTTVLDVVGANYASLSLGRSAGDDFTEPEAELATRLSGHIAAALRVRRELRAAHAERAAALAALDQVGYGIFLLAARGRVCFANREAERILAANDGLSADATGLRTEHPPSTAQLQRLVAECAAAARGRGLAAGGNVQISRRSARPPYAVHVAPLATAQHLLKGLSAPACVAVFVRDPLRKVTPPTTALCDLYGLTRAEAVLAARIHEGHNLGEAARAIGVSSNTAKTQLKAVFEKVGVSRQVALVRRITVDFDA